MITWTDLDDIPTAHGCSRAQLPPARMDRDDRRRLADAAEAARASYPGPIGELLARELYSWTAMGHRFDSSGLMGRVVTELLGQ